MAPPALQVFPHPVGLSVVPPSGAGKSPVQEILCTKDDYRQCWSRLLAEKPITAYPALFREFHDLPITDHRREILLGALHESEAEFSLFTFAGGYRAPHDPSPTIVMGVLIAYATAYPESDLLLGRGFQEFERPFLESGGCFSSRLYDFPRKTVPFPYAAGSRRIGWGFLHIIGTSLQSRNCNDQEVTRILDDLAHLGGPVSTEFVQWIGQNRWIQDDEFARALLRYTDLIPFQEGLREPARRAVLQLIPKEKGSSLSKSDAILVEKGLNFSLWRLSRPKAREAVEKLARQCPAYRDTLLEMAGF